MIRQYNAIAKKHLFAAGYYPNLINLIFLPAIAGLLLVLFAGFCWRRFKSVPKSTSDKETQISLHTPHLTTFINQQPLKTPTQFKEKLNKSEFLTKDPTVKKETHLRNTFMSKF
ncbi:MAG: hypothetical protein LUH15_14455 [Tannerellaceae bacterium]|nr:hypothetical protein [Tannerellaceae bacterium]